MWGIVIGTVAGSALAIVLLRHRYILENLPMNSLRLNYGKKKEKWPLMRHDWYFQRTKSCLIDEYEFSSKFCLVELLFRSGALVLLLKLCSDLSQ
jgi:hypothetical protein